MVTVAAEMAAVIEVDAGRVAAVVVMAIFFLLAGMLFKSPALEDPGPSSIRLHSPSPLLPAPSSQSQTAQAA